VFFVQIWPEAKPATHGWKSSPSLPW
jgi:hypothetical protein